jgi:radical SAM superfamily enzyme YgiQ (UPF0313 family)
MYLVNPRIEHVHFGVRQYVARVLGKDHFTFPLALPLLAAMTPPRYDVRIVDDATEGLPRGAPHIVGITAHVSTIGRAYAIADHYRGMGAKVVMGGSYVTFMTEEALAHADAVVIGEAEGVWDSLLADFERGRLQKTYRSSAPPPFAEAPAPRWSLVRHEKLMVLGVQASRGCPYSCEFCLVPRMFGKKMRYRAVDDVVREIESLPSKRFFFVDDNLTFNKPWSRELMRKLAPLGVSWSCQSSVELGRDRALLAEMAAAGCVEVLIGFETIDPANLEETGKRQNSLEEYRAVIGNIHAAGIDVLGSFIVGFDGDGPESFDRLCEFTEENGLSYINLSMLTAAPGTDLYDRMKRDLRILDVPPEMVNGFMPVMRYLNASAAEMMEGYRRALARLSDFRRLLDKAMKVYAGGSFALERESGAGFFEKLRVTLAILKSYVFTRDRARRLFFKAIWKLFRDRKMAVDKAVIYLLTMEGNARYIPYLDQAFDRVRGLLSPR